uniref:Uncharacterized protein n=1 Tax=Avena sativa TaxID=4498 RepID=A0ACD6A4H3_AVESA
MPVRRWTKPPPLARAFSAAAPAARTTVPLAHLAHLPSTLPPPSHCTVTPPVQPWPRRLTPPFSDRAFLPLLRALPPLPSLRLFLSLPSFNSHPSVRSFNALLHSLVAARRLRLAAALFRAAPTKLYITPDLVSCNILLKGLVGVGDLDAALKVLDEMPGWGIVPDVVTYTTVLSAYGAKGDLKGAQKLFDDIIASGRRPDVTMYTVLIDGYCRAGNIQDAARVMDEMEASGMQPNEVTYSVVIEACCKEGKSAEARSLMREMLGAGYTPDMPLAAKVVDVMCQDGKAEEAYQMWRWMAKKNVPPDNTITSTLIYWLCKSGMVQEARKLFDELEKGFKPSLLTYNSLISGLCENGELQEAGQVWDDMVERRYEPNALTYEALIKGFCKIGKPNEAVSVFTEMVTKGCTPSKFIYQALVDSLSEPIHDDILGKILETAALSGRIFLNGDSWEVFIKKVLNTSDTWNKHLNFVLDIKFLKLFDELLKGFMPSLLTYGSLSEPILDDIVGKVLQTAASSGRNFFDGDSWEVFIRKVNAHHGSKPKASYFILSKFLKLFDELMKEFIPTLLTYSSPCS